MDGSEIRKPTPGEARFLLMRTITAAARERLVEDTRDFIKDEMPVEGSTDDIGALEVGELLREILRGTGYRLDGDVDYGEEDEA